MFLFTPAMTKNEESGTCVISSEKIDESSSHDWKKLGNSYYRYCHFDKAFACYSEAIKLEPTNPLFLANRCACLLEQGQYTAAMEDASSALNQKEIEPDLKKRLLSRLIRAAYFSGNKSLAYKMLCLYRDSTNEPALARIKRVLDYSLEANCIDTLLDVSSGNGLHLFDLFPRFRAPRLNEGFEYCPWGHGFSVSCLSGHLVQQDVGLNRRIHREISNSTLRINLLRLSSWQLKNTLHFFMGGCGDVRSICLTLIDAYRQMTGPAKKEDRLRIIEHISLYFVVNDVNPVVLARIVILLMVLNDLGNLLYLKTSGMSLEKIVFYSSKLNTFRSLYIYRKRCEHKVVGNLVLDVFHILWRCASPISA